MQNDRQVLQRRSVNKKQAKNDEKMKLLIDAEKERMWNQKEQKRTKYTWKLFFMKTKHQTLPYHPCSKI